MKAVAINGSPRKGGNTEILLKKALAPLADAGWETEFIQIGGTPIRGCQACYTCFDKKNSQCSQKDEVFNQCFEKMVAADAIILGSPTYFTDVRSEEHTSELQSLRHLVCRLLLEKKKNKN